MKKCPRSCVFVWLRSWGRATVDHGIDDESTQHGERIIACAQSLPRAVPEGDQHPHLRPEQTRQQAQPRPTYRRYLDDEDRSYLWRPEQRRHSGESTHRAHQNGHLLRELAPRQAQRQEGRATT